MPKEVITSLKVAINKTKGQLIDSADIKINQSFDYGYAFVVMEMMDRLRINEAILKGHKMNLPRSAITVTAKKENYRLR